MNFKSQSQTQEDSPNSDMPSPKHQQQQYMFSFQNTANFKNQNSGNSQQDSQRSAGVYSFQAPTSHGSNLPSNRNDTLDRFLKESILGRTNHSKAGETPSQKAQIQGPVSPNVFVNPITSGINSTMHGSPMNNTANFPQQQMKTTTNKAQFNLTEKAYVGPSTVQQRTLSNEWRSTNPPQSSFEHTANYNEQQLRNKLQNLKMAQQKIDHASQNLRQPQKLVTDAERNTQMQNRQPIKHEQVHFKSQPKQFKPTQNTAPAVNSFSPKGKQALSPKSTLVKSPQSSAKKQNNRSNIESRLYNDFYEKQKRHAELISIVRNKENQEFKHQPTISPKSKELAMKSNRNFMDKQNDFLYKKKTMHEEHTSAKLNQEKLNLQSKPKISNYNLNLPKQDGIDSQRIKGDRLGGHQREYSNPNLNSAKKIQIYKSQINGAVSQEMPRQTNQQQFKKTLISQHPIQIQTRSGKQIRSLSPRELSPTCNTATSRNDLQIINIKNQGRNTFQGQLNLKRPQTCKNQNVNFPGQKIFRNESQVNVEIQLKPMTQYISLFEKVAESKYESCSDSNDSRPPSAQTLPPQPYSKSTLPSQGSQNEASLNHHNRRVLEMILDQDISISKRKNSNSSGFESKSNLNQKMSSSSLHSTTQINAIQGAMDSQQYNLFQPDQTFTPSELELGSTMKNGSTQFSNHNIHSSTLQQPWKKQLVNMPLSLNAQTKPAFGSRCNYDPSTLVSSINSRNSGQSNLKDMSVLQRNEVWLTNKNKKIEMARNQLKGRETEGCTFEPKLFEYKPPRPGQRPIRDQDSFHMRHNRSLNGSNISKDESHRHSNSYSDIHRRKSSARSRSFDNLHLNDPRQQIATTQLQNLLNPDSSQNKFKHFLGQQEAETDFDGCENVKDTSQQDQFATISMDQAGCQLYKNIVEEAKSSGQCEPEASQDSYKVQNLPPRKVQLGNLGSFGAPPLPQVQGHKKAQMTQIEMIPHDIKQIRESVSSNHSSSISKQSITTLNNYVPLCQRVAKYTQQLTNTKQMNGNILIQQNKTSSFQNQSESTMKNLCQSQDVNMGLSVDAEQVATYDFPNLAHALPPLVQPTPLSPLQEDNTFRFKEKLNKAKETIARIRAKAHPQNVTNI